MSSPKASERAVRDLASIEFANELCRWYANNKRDLPFRKTRDPYLILVSEMMLQQTQMSTVLPYYERFTEAFPDFASLADASLDDVRRQWQGLGYYTRAKRLHDIAQTVMSEYGGSLPSSYTELKTLKGVGEYTASALASIAFNETRPALDGNVRRVMSRLLAKDFTTGTADTNLLKSVLKTTMTDVDARTFTEALMELGATVCRKKAACERCPFSSGCRACREGVVNRYPKPKTPPRRKREDYRVFVVYDDSGRFLWRRRPEGGLLGGLYEFPQYAEKLEHALKTFEETYDLKVASHEALCSFRHDFTHLTWTIEAYLVRIQTKRGNPCIPFSERPAGALSRAHLKIVDCLKKKNIVSPV